MAYQKFNVDFLLLVLFNILVLNSPHVRGRSHGTLTTQGSSPHEGTVKTIKGEDGEMVDCVDLYKQPAFNHPLLKDHKIQMDSSSCPFKTNGSNPATRLFQPWHRNGKCHKGTVPIIRRRQLQDTTSNAPTKGPHHEHASVGTLKSSTRYYGGKGKFSLWNPAVSRSEDFSASGLTVSLSDSAFMMAGWIVYPELYDDFKTRFFIYWTTDNSLNTGCFDLRCEGFVQVNKEIALGSTFTTVSTIGATTYRSLTILIYLDKKTGNWWLSVGDELIGYWPAALFSGTVGAQSLSWGGQIYDSIGNGVHTATDMGNGLFPGTNDASIVCGLQYVDASFTLRIPLQSSLGLIVDNPLCYDAEIFPTLDPKNGLCISFGGSGRNPKCP
ncbi:unnamed protein product [Amaranthus hypochondriacus]